VLQQRPRSRASAPPPRAMQLRPQKTPHSKASALPAPRYAAAAPAKPPHPQCPPLPPSLLAPPPPPHTHPRQTLGLLTYALAKLAELFLPAGPSPVVPPVPCKGVSSSLQHRGHAKQRGGVTLCPRRIHFTEVCRSSGALGGGLARHCVGAPWGLTCGGWGGG
jgi:hypothetical protein